MSSDWVRADAVDARLISGVDGVGSETTIPLGLEFNLAEGWHTYWRYPGDAGVPPHFDFSGSQNLKAVEVLWPAPRRLPEAGLDTIGYDRDVILPLRVTPQDPAKPVTLQVTLDYAICEKLCVPAETKAGLALAGGSSAQDVRLAGAEARVARVDALGAERQMEVAPGGEPRLFEQRRHPLARRARVCGRLEHDQLIGLQHL